MTDFSRSGSNIGSRGKPVIFFGDQWDRRRRRRQQLALRLAARDEVSGLLYIESPLPLTSLAKLRLRRADPDAVERWARMRTIGRQFRAEGTDAYVLTPRTFFRLTGIPMFDSLQHRAVAEQVVGSCRLLWNSAPGELDAITIVSHPWWPLSFYRSLGLKVDCYDCTDDFTCFPGLPGPVRRMLREQDDELARNAGLVTCVSQSLFEANRLRNPSTFHIPNGVDIALFSAPSLPLGIRKRYGIGSDAKLMGYAGGINKRLDYDLIEAILYRRPGWHLAIAGSGTDASLLKLPQVHLVGELSLDEVPSFLQEVDVCLIPHRVDGLTRSMDPQKIYDYLASGKPIVTTPVAGTERFIDLIEIARTPAEFICAVDRALAKSSSQREARLRAAAANSWDDRAERFWNLISECCGDADIKRGQPLSAMPCTDGGRETPEINCRGKEA